MSDSAEPAQATTSKRLPARTVIAVTAFSLSMAMLAVYLIVLRPASDDGTIKVEDLVNSAGLTNASNERVAVGQQVPAVTFEGLAGPDIALAKLTGTPVVLNFWASTCGPCVKEMPLLERAHQRYGDAVTFVGVDVFESESLGTAMVAKTGVTYLQGRDPASKYISQFGGLNLPHTVIIAADGKVSALHNRAITSDDELDRLISDAT